MQKFPSTEAKDKWGAITDAALQEPVTITKHGRPSLVVTSVRDYEELQRFKHEKLKADVAIGFEALDRGDSTGFEAEKDFRHFMDDVKKRGRERLGKARK